MEKIITTSNSRTIAHFILKVYFFIDDYLKNLEEGTYMVNCR